jgi:hypothetical protein
MRKYILFSVFILAAVFGIQRAVADGGLTSLFLLDRTGVIGTTTTKPSFDLNGPFFQNLGTNGRSCGSCHRPAQGWGISAEEVAARFEATHGLDPIFRTNDGSNCDHNIDTSTFGWAAQSL